MGRPINSRYIGPSTGPDDDKIRGYGVYANLGDGIVDSVILQQRSTSKFLIAPSTDLNNTMVAQLVNSDEPDVGQFFIDLIDTNDQRIKVRKLTNRRVYTADGSSYPWKLNVNGQVNIGNTELAPINIEPFVMVIDTSLSGNNDIFLSIGRGQLDSISGEIDWGDGTVSNYSSGSNVSIGHTYSSTGVYVISVLGTYASVRSNGNLSAVTEITSFGDNNVPFSLSNIASSLPNLTSAPSQIPNGTSRFASDIFRFSVNFNDDISGWDLSRIEVPLGSAGIRLDGAFEGATSFNQPLNSWDMSRTVTAEDMFRDATSFNQPLNNWDMSGVQQLSRMFLGATSFNQQLNDWDVSSATNMISMFEGASSFNQPLNNWDVRNVTGMNDMFRNASSFDQDLGNWQLDSIQFIGSMFSGSNISPENYTRTLIGWANHLFTLDSPPENVTMSNNNVFGITITFNDIVGEFNDLASAKNYLENTLNWTINDGDAVRAVFDTNASFEADTTLTTGNTVDGVDQVLIRELDLFGSILDNFILRIFHSEPAASPFNIVNQNGVWITNA